MDTRAIFLLVSFLQLAQILLFDVWLVVRAERPVKMLRPATVALNLFGGGLLLLAFFVAVGALAPSFSAGRLCLEPAAGVAHFAASQREREQPAA